MSDVSRGEGGVWWAGLFALWCFLHVAVCLLAFFTSGLVHSNLRVSHYWEQGEAGDFFGVVWVHVLEDFQIFSHCYAFAGAWVVYVWIKLIRMPAEKSLSWRLSVRDNLTRMSTLAVAFVYISVAYSRRPFGHAEKAEVYYALAGATVLICLLIKGAHVVFKKNRIFA